MLPLFHILLFYFDVSLIIWGIKRKKSRNHKLDDYGDHLFPQLVLNSRDRLGGFFPV